MHKTRKKHRRGRKYKDRAAYWWCQYCTNTRVCSCGTDNLNRVRWTFESQAEGGSEVATHWRPQALAMIKVASAERNKWQSTSCERHTLPWNTSIMHQRGRHKDSRNRRSMRSMNKNGILRTAAVQKCYEYCELGSPG